MLFFNTVWNAGPGTLQLHGHIDSETKRGAAYQRLSTRRAATWITRRAVTSTPGWGDTYDYTRFDQWIDIGSNPLPDGDYVLRSVMDPMNKIYESADRAGTAQETQEDNEATTPLTVRDGKLVDLAPPTGTVQINDVDRRTASPQVRMSVSTHRTRPASCSSAAASPLPPHIAPPPPRPPHGLHRRPHVTRDRVLLPATGFHAEPHVSVVQNRSRPNTRPPRALEPGTCAASHRTP